MSQAVPACRVEGMIQVVTPALNRVWPRALRRAVSLLSAAATERKSPSAIHRVAFRAKAESRQNRRARGASRALERGIGLSGRAGVGPLRLPVLGDRGPVSLVLLSADGSVAHPRREGIE